MAVPGPSPLLESVFPCPFKTIPNPTPPAISHLGNGVNGTPIATNAWWSNLMLGDGSGFVPQTPYNIKVANGNGNGVQISYPSQVIGPTYQFQSFNGDWSIGSKEPASACVVSQVHDLSVTLDFGTFSIPLVRGVPYISAVYAQSTTPLLSTIHAILSFTAVTPMKWKVSLNDGSTWLIYGTSPLPLQQQNGNQIVASSPCSVANCTLRIALLPPNGDEGILDQCSGAIPLNGVMTISPNSEGNMAFTYSFQMQEDNGNGNGNGLLFLMLPNHRVLAVDPAQMAKEDAVQDVDLTYRGIRGHMGAVILHDFILSLTLPTALRNMAPRFTAEFVPGNPAALSDIEAALKADIAALPPAGQIFPYSDSYGFGKVLARAARLALIADQIGAGDLRDTALSAVKAGLAAWFNGNEVPNASGDAWVYDAHFGIITTFNGTKDRGADYGAGLFNDVGIFHQGYHLYAAAVACHFDYEWGLANQKWVASLVQNIANLNRENHQYAYLRYHDAYELISYASGLVGFGDGCNKESTSEAANTYYAIALLGQVYNDMRCAAVGHLLAANDVIGAQTYWHMNANAEPESPVSEVGYDASIAAKAMVGNLFSNKIDLATWFSPAPSCTLGIQVIPITPWTRVLFSDTEWAQSALAYVQSVASRSDTTPSWLAFLLPLQLAAGIPSASLLPVVKGIKEFDNGNSLSNMLYLMYCSA